MSEFARICGPNGRWRDATFHVHSADCADPRKYGAGGRLGGESSRAQSYDSVQEIVEDWYQDQIFSDNAGDPVWGSWEAYESDFRVFPCLQGLPRTTTEAESLTASPKPVSMKTDPTTDPKGATTVAKTKNTPTPAAEAKAPKAQTACICGCGELTDRSFKAGHDNRLYGQVRRGEKPESAIAAFPGLVNKLEWAKRKDATAAARKAEKAETEAKTSRPAEAGASRVKIGRWEYDVVSVEPIEDGDGLVRVTYLVKGVEKSSNVNPKALS